MALYRNLFRTAVAGTMVTLLAGCGAIWMSSNSNKVELTAQLTGAQQVPPVTSTGSGQVNAWFDKSTNTLKWHIVYQDLSGPTTAAHFHGPAAAGQNAPVVLPFPNPVTSPIDGEKVLTPAQAADLLAGRWYANVHSARNPGGEIRGQLTVK